MNLKGFPLSSLKHIILSNIDWIECMFFTKNLNKYKSKSVYEPLPL